MPKSHNEKIVTIKEFLPEREKIAAQKKVLGFTNGCFDILHRGHVEYLAEARKLCDFLMVGVNSDSSVKTIKDSGRPIIGEKDRMIIIAALECVDYVIKFKESTPLILIRKIKPDMLFKGEDWGEDEIVGGDFVKTLGGQVKRIPLVSNRSTSIIIERIRKRYL